MLANAYFLARFRFDTAENEPAKNLQKIANFPNFANFAAQVIERLAACSDAALQCAANPLLSAMANIFSFLPTLDTCHFEYMFETLVA